MIAQDAGWRGVPQSLVTRHGQHTIPEEGGRRKMRAEEGELQGEELWQSG